ncbi:hypothetical protein EQV77_13530 [Halobacillus fulvus]|nr:hypothetical protein EQV77_13530 [Halobacillus fulvus]
MTRKKKRRCAPKFSNTNEDPMSDENFYFIAGHTPAGIPFGITHEQVQNMDLEINDLNRIGNRENPPIEVEDDDLPF